MLNGGVAYGGGDGRKSGERKGRGDNNRKIEYFGGGSRRIHEIYLRKRNFSTYYHFQRLETRLPRLYLERPEERMEKKRREKKILG